jgi:O-antigen/teichoic acid export membrane protein
VKTGVYATETPATGVARGRTGRTLRRGIAQLSLLGASQVGVTLVALGTQVFLARALSREHFGAVVTVMSLVTLVGPLALFGVAELWLQRFGREGPRAFRWVRPSLRLVGAGTAVLVVTLLLWGALDRRDPVLAAMRIALSLMIPAQVAMALAGSVLQLRGAYAALAILQLLPQSGRFLVAVAAWLLGLSVFAVAASFAVVAALTVLLAALVLVPFKRTRVVLEGHVRHRPTRAGRSPRPAHLIQGASPFMLGSVFYLLGIHLGVVVSGEFLSRDAAALLAVPTAMLTAVYLLPRVIYQQYFLAKLHRWSRFDTEALLIAYRLGTWVMSLCGIGIALLIAVGGLWLIPAIFGSAYHESTSIMALLALAIPLRFAAASLASLLTSGGLLRRKVLYQGVGAAAYVGGLCATIPVLGVMGVALTTVLTEATLLALFWRSVQKHIVAGATLPSWSTIRRRLLAA